MLGFFDLQSSGWEVMYKNQSRKVKQNDFENFPFFYFLNLDNDLLQGMVLLHSASIPVRQSLRLMNWQQNCIVSNKTTSKLAFKFCQSLHKAYRQVCCKEPLSFGWKITSLVSFGFAPFNLHCYGKPLDLGRAQNHWGHHNRVWQLPFSHLFGSKIKIPGKVNPGSAEISHTNLETAVLEYLVRYGIHTEMNCTCTHLKQKIK